VAVAGLTHAAWLARVPSALAECATAWGLTPGQAYAAGAGGDDRARGLTIAQTVAWSGGSECIQPHVDTVRWLLEGA
jgi:hypothetical protein